MAVAIPRKYGGPKICAVVSWLYEFCFGIACLVSNTNMVTVCVAGGAFIPYKLSVIQQGLAFILWGEYIN